MGVGLERVTLAATTPRMRVFQARWRSGRGGYSPNAAARFGRSILTASSACSAAIAWCARLPHVPASPNVRRLWEDTTIYNGDSVITPDMFVIIGSQIIDLSGVNSIDQALAITRSEFDGLTRANRWR